MATEKTHLALGSMDPEWALQQARDIINVCPVTQIGSASGKFTHQYIQYMFHKSSDHPLIAEFTKYCEARLTKLENEFHRSFTIEWVYLAHSPKPDHKICIPHKDGYWMNGQIHLTIQGNSNILVWEEGSPWEDESQKAHRIEMANGTVWYLNGSQYWHSIAEGGRSEGGERFELLAPVNPMHVDDYFECLSPGPLKIIDPKSEKWEAIKRKQIQFEKKSQDNCSSSSPYNVGYIKGFDDD